MQAVKLEGGAVVADSIRHLVQAGIPVMAHIGFTPQSVNSLGGYRVQGRGDEAAAQLAARAPGLGPARDGRSRFFDGRLDSPQGRSYSTGTLALRVPVNDHN